MSAVLGQLEPLPGITYGATMSSSDIYPSHVGIGGIRTQDLAIPAFAEAIQSQHGDALATAALPAGLFNSPAGWLAIAMLVLLALVIWHGGKPRAIIA